jgi:hypothetical protein
MRTVLSPLLASVLIMSAQAAPAPRPALASDPLYSAGQVTDVNPDGPAPEAALYEALRSLIERYGVSGVSYTDKSVRKDLTLTAAEAKAALVSAYQQLAMLSNAAVDNTLAETSDDDAAKVISRFELVTDRLLEAAPACRLLDGTKYASSSKKPKAKPLTGNAPVPWSQALACLPGSNGAPLAAKSYNLKPAKPAAVISRGEFLHKLNEAMDAGSEEIAQISS